MKQNRRGFFRALGFGAAAVVAAPAIPEPKPVMLPKGSTITLDFLNPPPGFEVSHEYMGTSMFIMQIQRPHTVIR